MSASRGEKKAAPVAAPAPTNFYGAKFEEEIKSGEKIIYVISIKENGNSPEQSGEKLNAQLAALNDTGCDLTILIADTLQAPNSRRSTLPERREEAYSWGTEFLKKNKSILERYPHFKIIRWDEFLEQRKTEFNSMEEKVTTEFNNPNGHLRDFMECTFKETIAGHSKTGVAYKSTMEEKFFPYLREEYAAMLAMGKDFSQMCYVAVTSGMSIIFSPAYFVDVRKARLNIASVQVCTPRHGRFHRRIVEREFSEIPDINSALDETSVQLSDCGIDQAAKNKLMLHILTFIIRNTENFSLRKTGELIIEKATSLMQEIKKGPVYSANFAHLIKTCEAKLSELLKKLERQSGGLTRKRELLSGLCAAVDFRLNPTKEAKEVEEKKCESSSLTAPSLARINSKGESI